MFSKKEFRLVLWLALALCILLGVKYARAEPINPALANIPQVSRNSSFSVGAGVGSYDGEQGIAVGASARFNQNVVTKASVAGTTQSDFVFGAGVSYEW